jgi:hypothetical protein
MALEKQIDTLIEAGWGVIESDYDEEAFHVWRSRAVECLTSLVGVDHAYTRRFRVSLIRPSVSKVLSGVGVLNAAAQLRDDIRANDDGSEN